MPERRFNDFVSLLAGVLLLLGAGGLVACTTSPRLAPPIERGHADLSGWSFAEEGTLVLNGEWEFYWEEFLSPSTAPSPTGETRFLDTRYPWNHDANALVGQNPFPRLGYGTYVLTLRGLPKNTGLMLRLGNSVMAYELFWAAKGAPLQNQPTMANGTVHPTHPIPHSVNQVVPVQTGPHGEAVIVARVANQYWFMGGFFSPLWLGTPEEVGTGWKRFLFAYALAFGVILIMGLYHLLLHVQRPQDRSTLYFALFCLVQAPMWMAYTGMIPELFLAGTGVNGFLGNLYWIFLASYVSPPLFMLFLKSLFPEEIPARGLQLTLISFGSLILASLMLDFPQVSYLNLVYVPLLGLTLALGLVVLIRAALAGREGARLALGGFWVVVGTVGFDSFQTLGLIPWNIAWTPVGLVAFILAQSALISRRFATAHQQVEHYSANLEQEVRARTEELQQSTGEALRAKEDALENLRSLKESEETLARAHQNLKRSSDLRRRHMENLLAQGEQLSSLGRLIATVGHEIANPLSLISLASDEQGDQLDRFEETLMQIQKEGVSRSSITGLLEQIDELREYVGHNQTATAQLRKISHALRTQSRSESSPTLSVAIPEVMEEALLLCSGKLKRWTVTRDIQEVPSMTCYRSQVGQIFTNLVSNAADAVAEKAARASQEDPSHRGRIEFSIKPASVDGIAGVATSISDNGDGVREDHQSRLFEEFFTTKDAGMGTGLGLSLSRKLAHQQGGTLTCSQSASLGGACFTLWLPIERDASPEALPENPPQLSLSPETNWAGGEPHRSEPAP